MAEKATPEAVKHDDGKYALDLLPYGALMQVGSVLRFGAQKYAAHNWRNGGGLSWSRLLAAALRHLFAWGRGEDYDPETGYNHLAHAACCVLFLLDYTIEGGGTDDRWKCPASQESKVAEKQPTTPTSGTIPTRPTIRQLMYMYKDGADLPDFLHSWRLIAGGSTQSFTATFRDNSTETLYCLAD